MSLDEWRSEIDRIDHQIVSLLGERIKIAKKISRLKKDQGLPILDTGRETAIKEKIQTLAREHHLSPVILEEIFTILLDYSRLVQESEE